MPACRQAGKQACRSTGKQDDRMDSGQAGRRTGWSASRLAGQSVYAHTLYLLYHPFIASLHADRRMYCTTDLYHPNSTPLNPHPIADTFIWSFVVVNQYDSKPVNQRTIETMLFPICTEWLFWLSASIHYRFCKLLVRCVCKQVKIHLSKITFSYWSKWILAAIGTDWYRIDAIVCISGKWKSGFRSLRSQIRFGLITDLHFRFSFGQLGHRKTML